MIYTAAITTDTYVDGTSETWTTLYADNSTSAFWLWFDATTMTFSGTPAAAVNSYTIKLMAKTNTNQATAYQFASTRFANNSENAAPAVTTNAYQLLQAQFND